MDGIVPIWKPHDWTSHDVVNRLRHILGERKIGHTGTLDPAVDGVLVCCVGKATKLVALITDKEKAYRGEITLGLQTDTEDQTGHVVRETPLQRPIPDAQIQAAMDTLVGTITQIPPMYSAVRVNGRHLYDYARRGETVARPERTVSVSDFALTAPSTYEGERHTQRFSFAVTCGKGTYVRTLATDLGKKLNMAATMTALTRTRVGRFTEADCYTLDELAVAVEHGESDFLLPIDRVFMELPRWNVPEALAPLVLNGAVLHQTEIATDLPARAYVDGRFVALYDVYDKDPRDAKPRKMFI